MRVEHIPFELDMLDATMRERGKDGRMPGPHLSDVVRDLANATIHKGKRQRFAELTRAEQSRMARYVELGFSWEALFEREFRKRMHVRSGRKGLRLDYQTQLRKGGLWMTPDAIDDVDWELWEFKLTWKTVRRIEDIEQDPALWEWLVQIRAYLHTLKMSTCHLLAYFVNGDYSEPRVPVVRHVRLTFEPHELEANWGMIMNHKKLMQRSGLLQRIAA